jgi:hypothetical protein
MSNRREFLLNGSVIGAGLVLVAIAGGVAGCQGTINSQLVSDVNLLSSGLSGLTAALAALPANEQPSAAVLAQINAAIADLQSNAGSIANALTPSTSTVTAIQTAVSTIASLATPFFPASGLIASVVEAAVAVAANLVTMLTPPQAPASIGGPAKMAVPQARLVLAAAPVMLHKP